MKTVFFGLSNKYEDGCTPSIAINAQQQVVEIHNAGINNELWYRLGQNNQGIIEWQTSVDYRGGCMPAVTLNDNGYLIEVHQTDNITSSDLFWNVWSVQNNSVSVLKETQFASGDSPCVALNNHNMVVAAYANDSTTIRCRFGKLNTSSNSIDWIDSQDFNGKNPSIAINNNGLAFITYEDYNSEKMKYRSASFTDTAISWSDSHTIGKDDPDGKTPVVAITDESLIFVVYKDANNWLSNMTGQFGSSMNWGDPTFFDYGMYPKIATNGTTAVQVHQSEATFAVNDMYYSNCLVLDRKQWMKNLLPIIGNKTLGEIVMPATHDAGMSEGGLSTLGKTQDRDILGQLEGGVRYFDLRPEYDDNDYYTYHNFSDIKGQKIDDVLDDVYTFMSEKQTNELVILKFSHWGNFDDMSVYVAFITKIQAKIADYLYKENTSKKLGTIKINDFVGSGGKVLVVCDNDYALNYHQSGIYVYRDGILNCDNESRSTNPTQGDLVVFDCYSNTLSEDTMISNQMAKFNNYNGFCDGGYTNTPCDMFLLSWTLTPVTAVWSYSEQVNKDLGQNMSTLQRNSHGKIPNLIYVDYFEYSRVADICVWLTQRLIQ